MRLISRWFGDFFGQMIGVGDVGRCAVAVTKVSAGSVLALRHGGGDRLVFIAINALDFLQLRSDRVQQFFAFKRFGNVVVSSQAHASAHMAAVFGGGQHNNDGALNLGVRADSV